MRKSDRQLTDDECNSATLPRAKRHQCLRETTTERVWAAEVVEAVVRVGELALTVLLLMHMRMVEGDNFETLPVSRILAILGMVMMVGEVMSEVRVVRLDGLHAEFRAEPVLEGERFGTHTVLSWASATQPATAALAMEMVVAVMLVLVVRLIIVLVLVLITTVLCGKLGIHDHGLRNLLRAGQRDSPYTYTVTDRKGRQRLACLACNDSSRVLVMAEDVDTERACADLGS